MPDDIQKTLDLIKAAQGNPIQSDSDWQKAFTQSTSPTTGLTYYDLQAPALIMYPMLTPWRNKIPRVGAGKGTQANWKAVTSINLNSLSGGVSEGNRGGVIATGLTEYLAAFRGLGFEDYVTFEAEYAGEGFEDVRARATQGLLRSAMIYEEKCMVGGNGTYALGQAVTPTLGNVSTGGTLAAQTWSVICAALTPEGLTSASLANGVRGQLTRTNADGSSDTYGGGTGKLSTNATVVTTGATSSITATTTAVAGAAGYAWFWGAAGAEVLGAITTINSLVITAAAAGTQTAASVGTSDNSKNTLVFDGVMTQVIKTGVGYYSAQATGTAGVGTPLTSDGAGGIIEIDTALQWFWDNLRLSPSTIWVNSQEQKNITKKILAGSANAAQRFTLNVEQGNIKGGDLVRSYLNKFGLDGSQEIPIKLHPNVPAGSIIFDTDDVPYPLSGIANLKQMRLRQDYMQIEWPRRSRKYEYGIYLDGVLQIMFPPAFGMITNIANG